MDPTVCPTTTTTTLNAMCIDFFHYCVTCYLVKCFLKVQIDKINKYGVFYCSAYEFSGHQICTWTNNEEDRRVSANLTSRSLEQYGLRSQLWSDQENLCNSTSN